MHAFKDSSGKEWQFRITFGTAKAIKEKVGIDVGIDKDLLRLFSDREVFLKVVELILTEQLVKAEVSDEYLLNAFDGETWQAASDALEAEIYFFSPNRKVADKIIPAVKNRQLKLAAEVASKIEAGEFDQTFAKLASSKSDTDSVASPESQNSTT